MSTQADIRVLHVDDDRAFAELTAEMLEHEDDRMTVEFETSAADALDRLVDREFDCVVSDYDMPDRDGIEFLEGVRADHPDLPFILFTGKGGEAVASDALRKGATDYLQKGGATEQYHILANRIRNAVERYETECSRRQWKRAVETATEGIALVDEDGTFLRVNRAYADAHDAAPEDLVGTDWRRWYPDDEVARFEAEILPQVRHQGAWEGESVARRTDGAEFPQRLSLSLLDDGGHVRIIEDITERKERERELEQAELVFEHAQEAIVLLAVTDDREFVIERVNPALAAEADLTPAEFVGKTMPEIVGEEEGREMEARYRTVLEQQEPMTYEESVEYEGTTRYWRSKLVPIIEDGTVTHILGTATNITERKERERQLERSYDRYRSLFENNPLVIWEEDISESVAYLRDLAEEVPDLERHLRSNPDDLGRVMDGIDIIDVNRAAVEYYEAPSKKALIDSPGQVFTEEAIEQFVAACAAIAAGESQYRTETTARTFDGETKHELLELRVPEAYRDDCSRVYVTGMDITDRKHKERELERQNERLDEFAAIVSHDLRNPLQVAMGALGLVAEECDSDHLEMVSRAHERMDALIEDLLTLARQGHSVSEVETIELAAAVETCLSNIRTDDADVTVDTDHRIEADPGRLHQVLENLIRNSIEHAAPDAGGADEAQVTVTVGSLADGFYVEDDGPGIPEDERSRILESGYSTSEDGTGFGLTIVKRIAEAHGWSVAVTDGDGGGARFEFSGVSIVE